MTVVVGVRGKRGVLLAGDSQGSTQYSNRKFAVRGRLFVVDDDLQVSEGVLAYEALGSGDDVAIGSLHGALGDQREPIQDSRVEKLAVAAVDAAAELTNFVGGDITSVRTVLYTDDERALARKIASGK